jgi:septal ring factor EnvC (AmiA/AmiB activator)
MRRILSILLVLALAAGAMGATTQDEIRKRQVELEAIRTQIRQFEEKIKQHQKNESEILELLDTYDRKSTLVRKLIARLRADEGELQRRIAATAKEREKLEEAERRAGKYRQYLEELA